MKTQEQMYYDAEKKAGQLNEAIMELIRNKDITNAELQKLIEKRPEVYSRFSWFIGKLTD